jgi:serine/threonine protein phosphatase PrpC
MHLDSYVFSGKGGREYNEDSAVRKETPPVWLYAVADGLGGHLYGEEASACVTGMLIDADLPEEVESSGEWLTRQIILANDELNKKQKEKGSSMKSTVVALMIRDDIASWAHTGDSRLYYIHDGEIEVLTEDHSVAYKKYKAGEISYDDIAFDDDQSRLLKVLGNDDRYEPIVTESEYRIEAGDGFLLCSDGLWEYVKDEEMLIDFLKSDNPEEWGTQILMRAMDRVKKNHDNISLITVMVESDI